MTEKQNDKTSEVIKLLVRPNSAKTIVDGLYQDRIKIRIASPPDKGRANRELIEFISKKTGVPKTFIRIISGGKSNFKEIEIKKDKETSFLRTLLDS